MTHCECASLAVHWPAEHNARPLVSKKGWAGRLGQRASQRMSAVSSGRSSTAVEFCANLAKRIRSRLTSSGNLPARPAACDKIAQDSIGQTQARTRNGDHVVDSQWARYRKQMHDHLGWSLGFSRTPSSKKKGNLEDQRSGGDTNNLREKASNLRRSWQRREQRKALGKSCASAAAVLAATRA